ncbi:hypothetical protein RJ639_007345 [Escallonia herrerae]|uniref:Prolamin-like domain-containing protein n=1 Tax=Escallonia herrerae TaxID=1293975 RepID=A0AA88VUZ7_9ASTE|nr:hypothetical protein RJ639_007345 [Escallonia herrerae]
MALKAEGTWTTIKSSIRFTCVVGVLTIKGRLSTSSIAASKRPRMAVLVMESPNLIEKEAHQRPLMILLGSEHDEENSRGKTMAMVFYKFPFAILALFLVNGAVHALAKCRYRTQYDYYKGDDVTCLYPWDNDGDGYDLPSEPRTSFYNDLNGCVKVLTRKCSQQKYNYIFHKKKIDIQCCRKLIDMGRECDESLIWTLSNTKRYDRHSEVIRKRSDRAFEKCEKALRKESGW